MATMLVLVNGSPTDEFPLERGLGQGDTLSPFFLLLAAEGLNILMKFMVERNLFIGYSVGELDLISVLHLQFADDTLLLGVKSWANVCARAVLVIFETMSGLKVNFNKSMLVGVNISDSWLGEVASALGCKVGKVPFLYPVLSIGGDPRRLVGKPLRKEYECLGVRQLSPFWGRAREIERRGRRRSLWLREIVRNRDGGYEVWGGRFGESISKKVGDEFDTFFWTDPWVDEIPLCERFGRLFDLTETKLRLVAEMTSLGWGAGGEAWVWRRLNLLIDGSDSLTLRLATLFMAFISS
ncbi:hypothetical protein TSUD_135790 [Trifolium subterraneum]|uniref:Reverse transcriptase domain-containing protein n=1 Tax=Trifolium subterraneum TaxID=3900 RepID=A0A2Z6NJ48_TRISU|nr:hypothetical protein TSUD_135790 [Trifolium subterraneum]